MHNLLFALSSPPFSLTGCPLQHLALLHMQELLRCQGLTLSVMLVQGPDTGNSAPGQPRIRLPSSRLHHAGPAPRWLRPHRAGPSADRCISTGAGKGRGQPQFLRSQWGAGEDNVQLRLCHPSLLHFTDQESQRTGGEAACWRQSQCAGWQGAARHGCRKLAMESMPCSWSGW